MKKKSVLLFHVGRLKLYIKLIINLLQENEYPNFHKHKL